MNPNKSSLIYLDTNIYSLAVKDQHVVEGLHRLASDGYAFVASETTVAELYRADRKHEALARLVEDLPVYFLRSHVDILREAINVYPKPLNVDPVVPGGRLNGSRFAVLVSSAAIVASSGDLTAHARDVPGRYLELRDNFPPSRSGVYTQQQANEFIGSMTIQWLKRFAPEFMRENFSGHLQLEPFITVMCHAALVFWKFYLGRRTPNPSSDLGDQAHARFYPLCAKIVVENDTADCIRQMKKSQTYAAALLGDLDVMNVKDLRAHGSSRPPK